MNFRTLALTTTLALSTVLGGLAPEAKSADFCDNIPGNSGYVCVTMGLWFDLVEADIPAFGGKESLHITCDGGWSYRSNGNWNKDAASLVAKEYCEGAGWNSHSEV
ncbi:hypothetical protein Syn7803US13_90 [Synechococcus phage ACG-2014f]|uniref:Uncharacterized protein n=2 Tax=Atlauavirus TaxID=2733092 RepID=A0A0E3IC63_9CAUD|nr:hypothetical protein HOQ63_gp089 [Synechococcus phage ACG-2014f_Syn7803US26]AIX23286.1 hypothetical protein Syn7803C9_96 [Synechococcus phage ACG-2014f]AIX27450.1 hypothetical protein Syn7803US13_90 [Synechococcus phage ACG-2014f]AIX28942.1 hypothetical protein Syn7803US26_89 [Synechococcus phage ACG-2014f_Syn7803US26]AIX31152.1 hypothetical protein Syn7803US3_95 [Synechococcus phage ACG-2014f]AIX32794.1 hypothetical protein Syn7803US4_93 [Synechococcus phage ACG-2014f]